MAASSFYFRQVKEDRNAYEYNIPLTQITSYHMEYEDDITKGTLVITLGKHRGDTKYHHDNTFVDSSDHAYANYLILKSLLPNQ